MPRKKYPDSLHGHDLIKEHPVLAHEQIRGMDAIRYYIDPLMSKAYFYRHWRVLIEPILCEYPNWRNREPPIRYFVLKRFLEMLILDHCRPSHSKRAEARRRREQDAQRRIKDSN